MAFKVIIIVIGLLFLGINVSVLALLRAHLDPRYARANIILSRAKNIFMLANVILILNEISSAIVISLLLYVVYDNACITNKVYASSFTLVVQLISLVPEVTHFLSTAMTSCTKNTSEQGILAGS